MKTLLTPYQIRAGVLSITEKLMTRHNPTTPIVMIGVMRGGFMFYNDLVDDILDSGITYEYLKVHYEYKNSRSVEGIFALKKYNEKYKQEMCILSLPPKDERWLFGYGMDDEDGGNRHQKGIYWK